MKRYLFRTSVFTAAFLISVGLALGWAAMFGGKAQTVGTASIESPVPRPILSGEVEVRYLGFIEKEGQLYAQFEVTNGTSGPVLYSGYEKGTIAGENLYYENKQGTQYGICGTGLNTYELASGASFVDEVHYARFQDYYNKTGDLQIAYWLKRPGDKEYKYHKSDHFRLPKEVKQRLADDLAGNNR